MLEGSPPIFYRAAGGVVVHAARVLVLRRPGRDEVRLPKGQIDPGEDAPTAALREVAEESGYFDLVIRADLGHQTVRYVFRRQTYVRDEYYFLMGPIAAELTPPRPPEAQFEPAWLSWEAAVAALSFTAEREWVRRARRLAS